jgi:hypothetical protein
LLYFFHPSPRRWFYFSENPLNSDQVRWLLSLETQELSCHNQYKCQTSKWGALRPSDSLLGIFLVILALKISSGHFYLSIISAVLLARDKIWLCKLEWTDYGQFRHSLET